MLATVSPDARSPLSPYALYGTDELAGNAAAALGGDKGGCLLANHGMLAVGPDPATAMDHTVVMEEVAAIYYHALAAGKPVLLNQDQVTEVSAKIAGYGPEVSP
jgi:L-fuculose-phosphate aldolase